MTVEEAEASLAIGAVAAVEGRLGEALALAEEGVVEERVSDEVKTHKCCRYLTSKVFKRRFNFDTHRR